MIVSIRQSTIAPFIDGHRRMTPHYTTTGAQVLRNGQPFARVTSPEHAEDVAAAMQRRAEARSNVVRSLEADDGPAYHGGTGR